MSKTYKACTFCHVIKPIADFPLKSSHPYVKYRGKCKECYNSRQNLRYQIANSNRLTTKVAHTFSQYETHPVLSPIPFSLNILLQEGFLSQQFTYSEEYRTVPHHFILFHLLPHKYHAIACTYFKSRYCFSPESNTIYSHYLNQHISLSILPPADREYVQNYLHPDSYTPALIKRELYESYHHTFHTNPFHKYYRHRVSTIMRKTYRLFFSQTCRQCNRTLPTYHINYSPTDPLTGKSSGGWLRYLFDTIFSYDECVPLPINFFPAFSIKCGWYSTCNDCRRMPYSQWPVQWEDWELSQGFSTRHRVRSVILATKRYFQENPYTPPSH